MSQEPDYEMLDFKDQKAICDEKLQA